MGDFNLFIVAFFCFVAVVLFFSTIKQINQYERGIKFRFGKFVKILQPGWKVIIPVIESIKKVDVRTKAVDVPAQEAITRDNVSVQINAVLYYKIFDSSKAVLEVENFMYAVGQLAQTTMRNVVGWGITVENVELKDVALPVEMKRSLAVAAEAEREKSAVITKAQGELEASNSLAKAAKIMSETPGAMHLRTLATLSDLSSDQSNTIIFCLPVEVLTALQKLGGKTDKE